MTSQNTIKKTDAQSAHFCFIDTHDIKLIEEDQVFALFNYVGTPTVTRMLPLLYRYQNQAYKYWLTLHLLVILGVFQNL